jgi:hypothetical protein
MKMSVICLEEFLELKDTQWELAAIIAVIIIIHLTKICSYVRLFLLHLMISFSQSSFGI